MDFRQADEFNATHGTQFIADLMPKTPIYTAMLPETARAVMGVPHPSGRAAMKMLEKEGFKFDCYVDIFDGGPTMSVETDDIRTIRDSREETLAAIEDDPAGGQTMMVAAGRLLGFNACYGRVHQLADGGVSLDSKAAEMLGLKVGDTFLTVGR
jgi:arginine N-succinyltransferase